MTAGDKEEVITHQYNDDSKNAYIAVPHDPWHPDAPKDIDAATNDDAALDIDVKVSLKHFFPLHFVVDRARAF